MLASLMLFTRHPVTKMVPKGPLEMLHLLDLYYKPRTLINTSLLGLCDVIELV